MTRDPVNQPAVTGIRRERADFIHRYNVELSSHRHAFAQLIHNAPVIITRSLMLQYLNKPRRESLANNDGN